ncbi:MAG: YdcF family protein, partial [Bacteroidota bacterium]
MRHILSYQEKPKIFPAIGFYLCLLFIEFAIMFFILSKILYFIFSPLNWIITILLIGLFSKKPRRKKNFITTGIVLLILFTNPFILNISIHAWEIPSCRIGSIKEAYDVGVVLGGAMRYYNSEMDRVVYGSSVDRLIQSISLYREGKIKKILVSGGSGLLLLQQYKEAELLKKVLLEMNIPDQDILIENQSKNTRENAFFSAQILKNNYPGGRILLITSGYHMRRSLGCFKKAGINPDPFSVDEHSGKVQYTPDKLIMPDAANLQSWDALLHEWGGYVSYWMVGYI